MLNKNCDENFHIIKPTKDKMEAIEEIMATTFIIHDDRYLDTRQKVL